MPAMSRGANKKSESSVRATVLSDPFHEVEVTRSSLDSRQARLPRRKRIAAFVALGAAVALALGIGGYYGSDKAAAQSVDCAGLRAQIAALDQASVRSNPYAGELRRQRAQLQHLSGYAHSLGCDHQVFFFGPPPPPQCGGLNGQIQQLQASIGQLEANTRGGSDSPQRQQLMASYNYYCERQQQARQPGFFESLFGGQHQQDVQPPPQPLDELPPEEQAEKVQGGSEVLCVRQCDGGFFPLNYSPGRGYDTLTDFCKASCPNTEVSVYTRVPGEAIQTAVGLDGKPYMDLPAALKYQKSLDPSCSCRKSGASWADTLGDAEAMLTHNRKDVVVTQEKSDEMARPLPDPKVKAAGKSPVPSTDDNIEATDAAAAAQVPTASTDSAGIATGDVKNGTAFPQGKGQTMEVTGADGVKRRVRIVGPQP